MAQQIKTTDEHILNSTELALERTIMAEKRTLMAWIRTAISMISFGFTIYKFFHDTSATAATRLLTPRTVGMAMILFGLLTLIFGLIESHTTMKKLTKEYNGILRSNIGVLSVLILFFGLALFLAALFRQ